MMVGFQEMNGFGRGHGISGVGQSQAPAKIDTNVRIEIESPTEARGALQ